MSADLLRRAAVLMREKAEASRTAFGYCAWRVDGLDENGQYVVVPTEQIGLGSRVAGDLTEDDAEHISSWHPAVALAVADWLETFIEGEWPYCDCGDLDCLYGPCLAQRRALAVARAYLGEDA